MGNKQSGGIMPWDSLVNFTGNMIDLGVNSYNQNKWNKKQQKNWEDQFNYQKELNNMLMQREDTAVQRRAKDLQAAGFNKLLAATGEAASVSGMTTFGGNAGGGPNKIDTGEYAPFQEYLALRQAEENIQLTKTEREKKEQERLTEIERTNQTKVDTALKEAQKKLTYAEKDLKVIEYIRQWHDYNIDTEQGIKSNDITKVSNPWELGWKSFTEFIEAGGYSRTDLYENIWKYIRKKFNLKDNNINNPKIPKEDRTWLKMLFDGVMN